MTIPNGAALAKLKERAQVEIDLGVLPSCQYALALNGEIIAQETFGDAPADSRYSIWSATKPVFASLIWQLMADGTLDVSSRVVDLWPEFGAHGKDKVTLEHLLLFTAGFPSPEVSFGALGDRTAMVREMEQWTLDWEPGTAWGYHGISAHMVMAEMVARTVGDHRVALRERVLDPLGLERLELGIPESTQTGIRRVVDGGTPATAEEIAAYIGLPELPPALLAAAAQATDSASAPRDDLDDLQAPRVIAAGLGGAGGVSDAASIAMFYQHLLHNTDGVFDPAVLADVTGNVRNRMVGAAMGVVAMRTLGLEVQGDDPTAKFRIGAGVVSPRTFGHGGAGGQIAWADPETGLSFSYLTDGNDLHAIRQGARVREINAAAAAVVAD